MDEKTREYMTILGRTYSYADIKRLTGGLPSTVVKKLGKKAGVWEDTNYVIKVGKFERFTDLFFTEIICNREEVINA